MLANRMSYVVFYRGKYVLKKLEELPVDISYVSEKQNYVVIYADKEKEADIKKELKHIKGFKGFVLSQLYDESLNF